MTTMNSLEGSSAATAGASTENMRSTAAKMGGRALYVRFSTGGVGMANAWV